VLLKPDYAAWRFWLDVVVLLAVFGNTVYTWWVNSKKATAKRFKQMEGTLADKVSRQEMDKALVGHEAKCHSHRRQTGALEAALGKLQTDVGHLPSRHEIQGLNDSITSLGKEMGKLEGRLDGINRAVDLVNEFLINQGGKQ